MLNIYMTLVAEIALYPLLNEARKTLSILFKHMETIVRYLQYNHDMTGCNSGLTLAQLLEINVSSFFV